jgi:predicted kinase
MATLYMMLGLPGSGKSTTAEIICQITGAVHLSSDNFRLALFPQPTFTQDEHDQLYFALNNLCRDLLASGKSVVYDANLNRYEHRVEKYDLAVSLGATTQLLWLQTDTSLAKRRRTTTQQTALLPPGEESGRMFDRVAELFQPPKKNEPHIGLDGTRITPKYLRQVLGL